MLKIGDKVRAAVSAQSHVTGAFFFERGEIGTITKVFDDSYDVDWSENARVYLGGQWQAATDEVEPV